MWGLLRRIVHRYPPPREAVERKTPVVREVPEAIKEAAKVRQYAEELTGMRESNGHILRAQLADIRERIRRDPDFPMLGPRRRVIVNRRTRS